jgi:hypothetical protein
MHPKRCRAAAQLRLRLNGRATVHCHRHFSVTHYRFGRSFIDNGLSTHIRKQLDKSG